MVCGSRQPSLHTANARIGANSVVLPNVIFNEGATLGAMSLAIKDLEEYKVHAGIPAKPIKARNKLNILKLEQQFYDKS